MITDSEKADIEERVSIVRIEYREKQSVYAYDLSCELYGDLYIRYMHTRDKVERNYLTNKMNALISLDIEMIEKGLPLIPN